MKKPLLFVAILTTLIFFTACGQIENPRLQDDPQTTADKILDERILSDAIRAKNAEECERIESKAMQQECKDVIEANLMIEEAVENADKGLCRKIKLERYKEECEAQVARKIEELEIIAERKRQEEIRGKIAQEAYDTKNPNLCGEILDKNMRASCEFNAVIDKVQETKDASLCDKISKEGLRESCKEYAKTD